MGKIEIDPYAAAGNLVEGETPFWADELHDLISFRYFGCSSRLIDENHSVGSLAVRPDMLASGGMLIAPLAIASLEAAGNTLNRIYKLWLTQIDVHVFEAGHGVEDVTVENQVVRDARTQAFTEGRFLKSGTQRVLAQSSAHWAVLDRARPGFTYSKPSPREPSREAMPPLYAVFEAEKRIHGGYSIPSLSPRIGANVLHPGPIFVVMEAASLDIARSVAGPAYVRPMMMSCSLVRAGRIGPFSIEAELYCHTGDIVSCRTTLTDEGANGALLAVMFWQARLL